MTAETLEMPEAQAWMTRVSAAAEQGFTHLQDVWSRVPVAVRCHIINHDAASWWTGIKALARQADIDKSVGAA